MKFAGELTKDEVAKKFSDACRRTDVMLHKMYNDDMEAGIAIGGTLTTAIFHLLQVAPDQSAAFHMMSSCMSNAVAQMEMLEENMDGEFNEIH